MLKREIEKYKKLNIIAESYGTVILGNGDDASLPVCELADSFGIDSKFYNRSAEHLSIAEAISYYDSVIKPLNPERIILHLGFSDIEFFKDYTQAFDDEYRKLIEHIRGDNPKINIGIVSLCNPDSNEVIKELNSHLRMIAQSQRLEFEDIGTPRVWNPIETKNAMSFACALGLSKKVSRNKSLYDLAKIFFGLNLECVH